MVNNYCKRAENIFITNKKYVNKYQKLITRKRAVSKGENVVSAMFIFDI